jgi:hypothetical protein
MSDTVAWIAAEAERPEVEMGGGFPKRRRESEVVGERISVRGLPVHRFPAKQAEPATEAVTESPEEQRLATEAVRERERVRRVYRGRTVAMLRRYMRTSIETGRLPSLLGKEFFRAKVTAYTVVTFEDRVIFVHDMERCLERLDEFSRQLIAKHILQEHDQAATGRLLHCGERTVRMYAPIALDLLTEILLDVGLMERIESIRENSCQEGETDQIGASDCEHGE